MPVDAPVMTTDLINEFLSRRFSGIARRKTSPEPARPRTIF